MVISGSVTIRLLAIFLSIFAVNSTSVSAADATLRQQIVGDALINDGGYDLLETLSDRLGPRMIGTPGHDSAMDYLEAKLASLGIETKRQEFRYPGWRRGKPSVKIVVPFERELRVAEMGYASGKHKVEGDIVYLDTKDIESIEDLEGKVLLLKPNLTFGQDDLISLKERGALAALLTNRVNGGQLLARTANHAGDEPPMPLLSITQEEGFWIQRLIEDGETVRVSIATSAVSEEFVGTNLIATIPGWTKEKVVLGGHFDSWDLGQGSIDNGLGVTQIFEVARLLKSHSPHGVHTVELVWFDAEEFGLWGSRHYAEQMNRDEIRAMVNLDMVGDPIAVNAMGFDSLVPILESFSEGLGSWSFEKPVSNKTWLGSDHHPFILKGVPAITFNAPVDHDSVRYYHDFGDTFDKVDRVMLARASAIISLLVLELANDESPMPPRLSEEETGALFRKAGLEEKLKAADQWPFEDN